MSTTTAATVNNFQRQGHEKYSLGESVGISLWIVTAISWPLAILGVIVAGFQSFSILRGPDAAQIAASNHTMSGVKLIAVFGLLTLALGTALFISGRQSRVVAKAQPSSLMATARQHGG